MRDEVYEPRKSNPKSLMGVTKALSDAKLLFAPPSIDSEDEYDGSDCRGWTDTGERKSSPK